MLWISSLMRGTGSWKFRATPSESLARGVMLAGGTPPLGTAVKAPAANPLVIARKEHVGDVPALVGRRTRVVRVFRPTRKCCRERLLDVAFLTSERARKLSQNGVGDHHCSQLPAG